jgi:serine/threonine protein kinase
MQKYSKINNLTNAENYFQINWQVFITNVAFSKWRRFLCLNNFMTPEKWEKLKAIYYSALELNKAEQDDFLRKICFDDTEMFSEAQKLLADEEKTADFLKGDFFEVGMNILAQKVEEKDMKTIDGEGLIGGRYEILKSLGKGGIGEVFLANDTRLGNKVVVKFFNNDTTNDWLIKKFEDEPMVQNRVNHPNVAKALDKGVSTDGKLYLVMEFIAGENLADFINQAKVNDVQISFVETGEIIRQIGEGVNAIHHANLVHRDLKPANLMVKNGVKVIDFGIARDLTKGTRIGQSVATLSYASPEQLEGKDVTNASDIYSIGVIAYTMLTLNLPFNNPHQEYTTQIRLQQEGVKILPSLLRPDLPKEAETLILQALEYEPTKRPQNAKEFGDSLAKALAVKPKTPPIKPDYFKPLLAVASVLLLVLAGLAGWMWLGGGTKTVKADEIVATRPTKIQTENKPVENASNKPQTVSQTQPLSSIEKPVYDAENDFPTGNAPNDMVFAQIGLTFWRSRSATPQDNRSLVARETNDVNEEVVYESKNEFIKNGERFRFSIEAMVGDYLIDQSTNKFLGQKGGYVYVINRELNSDGTFGRARLIFPKLNLYNGENLFKSGQPIILPQKEGRVFEATRSSSKHIAEIYTIIISPWKFNLPEPLSNEPMILPSSMFASWEREYGQKMFKANLLNGNQKLMTIQEQLVMSRETNDVQESLTQSDTKTYPQTVYRGVVKIGNPSMFTVALKFND